jgi:zinc transport system substrate-binding protein
VHRIVFHDAYHYLERRYGLAATGSVTVAPERKPGARRVEEIRAMIRAAGRRLRHDDGAARDRPG